MKRKRLLLLLLAIMLSVGTVSPIHAAADDQHGAHTVVIQAGLAEMQVNGQPVEIAAPFVENGLTMVPMSVFIRGLGTDFRLKDNRTISLTLASRTVEAAIGSKSALLDGAPTMLVAAPAIRGGIVFLPVRTAELLGAFVTYDPVTQQVTIRTDQPGTGTGGGHVATIDSDAGKSWIGDSHYEWTMNYPTGLVQDYESESGDEIIFRDLKNEYYLGIFISEETEMLTPEERRDRLLSEFADSGEIVLDEQTIRLEDYEYDRITTKNHGGFYYEMRGLQANGFFYAIVFGKKAANLTDFRRHTDILDSFRPSFDRDDETVKNVTNRKDEVITHHHDVFGLTVDLPSSWWADNWGNPFFSSEEDDAYLTMQVTSSVPGDTLEDWVERSIWRYENLYAPEYRQAPDVSKVTWSGLPARMVKSAYSPDTRQWQKQYAIFAVHGKHRYYTEFVYPLDREDEYGGMLHNILDTMIVDFEVIEREFGNLPDNGDWLAEPPKIRKTNTDYGFSLEVPRHWQSRSYVWSDEKLELVFPGGTLSVSVYEYEDPAEKLDQWLNTYREVTKFSSKIRLIEDGVAAFAGKPAHKLVIEDARTEGYLPPRRITSYAFEHNGQLYVVEGSYGLANATEFVIGQLTAAMNSFRLLE